MQYFETINLDDNDGAIPLYSQVAYHIEMAIENGKLPIGSLLPSQKELSKLFNVSRITILKALELLRNEGIITSKQGKGSTVIKSGHIRTYQSEGFSARYTKLGKKALTHVISVSQEQSNAEVSERLHLIPKSKVVHIKRIRYLDTTPIGAENIYLNYTPKVFEICEKLKDDESLYALLEQHLSLKFTYAEEQLKAQLPTNEIQDLLKITPEQPVMKLLRVTYGHKNGPPLEFCVNYYNNETYGYYGLVSINLKS